MKKDFNNNYLRNNYKQLLIETPDATPVKGDIGGFSIEFTVGEELSQESILYRDEKTRDTDLELLTDLLSKR